MTKDYPGRYESFGGLLRACLVLFTLFPVYSVFRTVLLYVGAMGWLEGAEIDGFTTALLVSYAVSAGLAVWLSVSNVRVIRVPSSASLGKITRNLILYAVMSGILAAIQFVLIFLLPSQTLNFLSLELSNLLEAIVFVSVLLLYFLWSRRVQCYYCTEEEVGEIPPESPKETARETTGNRAPRSKREKASV